MKKINSYNSMQVKDVITIVVLSVFIITFMLAANFLTMFNHFFNLIFCFGMILFFCAPIYLLMAHRVNKTFTLTIFMGILMVIYLVMGYWYVAILMAITSVLLELFMKKPNSYKTPWKNTVTYSIFGLSALSTSFLPLWLVWDSYEKTSLANGMSHEYLQMYKSLYTNPPVVFGIIAFTLFGSVLGCAFGYLILNKYFRKSSLID